MGSHDRFQARINQGLAQSSPRFEDFQRSFSIIASNRRNFSGKLSDDGLGAPLGASNIYSTRSGCRLLNFHNQVCKLSHKLKQQSSRASISPSFSCSKGDNSIKKSYEISPGNFSLKGLASSLHNPSPETAKEKQLQTLSLSIMNSYKPEAKKHNEENKKSSQFFCKTEPDQLKSHSVRSQLRLPRAESNILMSKNEKNDLSQCGNRAQRIYSLNKRINRHTKEELEKRFLARHERICQTEEEFESFAISEGEQSPESNSPAAHTERTVFNNIVWQCKQEISQESFSQDVLKYGKGGVGLAKENCSQQESKKKSLKAEKSSNREELEQVRFQFFFFQIGNQIFFC
jgi:hypothetical protein